MQRVNCFTYAVIKKQENTKKEKYSYASYARVIPLHVAGRRSVHDNAQHRHDETHAEPKRRISVLWLFFDLHAKINFENNLMSRCRLLFTAAGNGRIRSCALFSAWWWRRLANLVWKVNFRPSVFTAWHRNWICPFPLYRFKSINCHLPFLFSASSTFSVRPGFFCFCVQYSPKLACSANSF